MLATASYPELLFTLTSFAGLALNLFALYDALGSLSELNVRGLNGARRVIAKNDVEAEIIRASIQLMFLLIAFAALVAPNGDEMDVLELVLTAGLIVVNALLVFKSFRARQARNKVIEILTRKGHRHEH